MQCYFVPPGADEPPGQGDDTGDPGVTSLSPALLARHGARVLDPAAVPVADPAAALRPTAYRTRTLLVPRRLQRDPFLAEINNVLARVGMRLTATAGDDSRDDLLGGFPVTAVLERADEDALPPVTVDAWTALTALRTATAKRGLDAMLTAADVATIGLEHLLFGAAITGSPEVHGHAAGDSYLTATSDSRIPVAVYADPPRRRTDGECAARFGRRPVIAVLDTGVRAHPWLGVTRAAPGAAGYVTAPDGCVQVDQSIQDAIYGSALAAVTGGDGARKLIRHPWDIPVTQDPLVGELSPATGHGTFIAGIVAQAVPDATVLSIRIMHSDDVVYEGDLAAALQQLVLRVAQAQDPAGPQSGLLIDALSLSLGYFPESPQDADYTSALKPVIDTLLSMGVLITASAGNDAVSRRCYPAAFAAAPRPAGVPPLVSVGALNPNGTRAIFSDDGCWVTAWAPGAMVVSTFPVDVNGAFEPAELVSGPPDRPDGQPPDRPDEHWRTREALDPDDFRGGFAVWSGTSFAAPALAAWLAAALVDGAAGDPALLLSDPARDAAVGRAWHALRDRGWQGP
jgi:hypothetical protein